MAKGKFYAVAQGQKPGIYSSWNEAEMQVKGFSGAKYKSFKTQAEAVVCMKSFDDDVDDLTQGMANLMGSKQQTQQTQQTEQGAKSAENLHELHGDALVAYCSGCALSNGSEDCTAVFTVFFPLEDMCDRSAPLINEPTNNRADCEAAIEATRIANELDPKKEKALVIYSRYQNLVNAMAGNNGKPRWIDKWQGNGWVNCAGKPVAHQDIYKALLMAEKERQISWNFVDAKSGPAWISKYHAQAHKTANNTARVVVHHATAL